MIVQSPESYGAPCPPCDETLAPHSHSATLRGLACVWCSAGVARLIQLEIGYKPIENHPAEFDSASISSHRNLIARHSPPCDESHVSFRLKSATSRLPSPAEFHSAFTSSCRAIPLHGTSPALHILLNLRNQPLRLLYLVRRAVAERLVVAQSRDRVLPRIRQPPCLRERKRDVVTN